MESSILLFLLVTLGALISSLTGLGGGTLILAGLMLVYPPEIALPLHSFTQFTANALRTGFQLKEINWKVVGAYSALMLPGAWAGAMVFEHVNSSWLKIIVGMVILISVMPFRAKKLDEPKISTFLSLGAISGFLGIFVGAVGPMVVPFFNRLKLKRDAMLGTKSAGQMMLQLSKIIAFSGAAAIDFLGFKSQIGLLVVGSVIGVMISIPLGRKISDDKFSKAVTVLLVMISGKVLFEGIREILF